MITTGNAEIDDKVTTFQENKGKVKEEPFDILNQCRRCGIRGGKFIEKDTGEKVGVYLLSDARGYKICNLCKDAGFYVGKRKMTKIEKKKFKALKRNLSQGIGLESLTVDAKGERVK